MWHERAITKAVASTLENLQRLSVLKGFYLAGGTGLALQLGHPRSIDLDFLSDEAFDPDAIIRHVEDLGQIQVISKGLETLHLTIAETKVSFLGHHYPLLFPCETLFDVKIADPRDIACMKISAIAGRGSKRDFIDLYVIGQLHPFAHLLAWFNEKYARAHYSSVHILKSLTYFEDAEKEPMPDMLASLTWETVKRYFVAAIPRLL